MYKVVVKYCDNRRKVTVPIKMKNADDIGYNVPRI